MRVRATPFHARAAGANPFNRWTERGGFTLALDYGDASAEAIAARTGVVLADISWRWRLIVQGVEAAACLSHLLTKKVELLAPGQSLKALWLNDGGALRGAGVVARHASDQFLVLSATTDTWWFAEAARQFDLSLWDATEQEGGLALVGPSAKAVLEAAGLGSNLASLEFRKLFWRGLDITISRWGEQEGYEIWCAADDCYLLWDRLMRVGAAFGICPAGVAANDILDIEAGVPRPRRDYLPSTDGFGAEPSPATLGLESLIDEGHMTFNGRVAWSAARGSEKLVTVGVEIDSETPASFVPLLHAGTIIGHTLTSVRSPLLRRAIALAQVEKPRSLPGTEFSLTLPLGSESLLTRTVPARVVSLPFLKPASAP